MWGERLKRLGIIFGVVILLAFAGKVLLNWQISKKTQGETIKLPVDFVSKNIQVAGNQVLGQAIKLIPGSREIQIPDVQSGASDASKLLEGQTQEILEIIKQLPAEELKQIKKQIFKDFCEEVLNN